MATGYERRWETRRGGRGGRSVEDESRGSYYGIPPIHKPHWNWLVVLYFFLGGIAGASYAIASIAQFLGDAESRRIARVGRYLSFATLLPSPILLILDLGRPARFHHMLRVVKLRSPLSVGSWILVLFGGCCTLSTFGQAAQDGLFGRGTVATRVGRALPARAIGALGLAPAFALSGYTGVVLAATAVPLWTKRALLMGPLFIASSVSNATAAITLLLALQRGTSRRTLKRLERLDSLALLAELGLLLTLRAGLGATIARPLVTGRFGWLYRIGLLGAGLGAPLALQATSALPGHVASRPVAGLAATLVLSGGVLFRYLILYAGRHSADDPAATFELTKAAGRRSA